MDPQALTQHAPELVAEIKKELARRSFREFVRQAWPIIEPGTPLVWGWVVDAICEHLEAVTQGEIKRLVINVPPGTMKSKLTSVLWPTYSWLHKPHYKFLSASYALSLAERNNVEARRILQSDWYSQNFGIGISSEEGGKVNFSTDKLGVMRAISVGGATTGYRGDTFLIDDPHDVSKADSDAKRSEAVTWFIESAQTRLNSLRDSSIVVVMQRVHEEDVTAVALDMGYEHLCIPMRWDESVRKTTSIGWTDPRTQEDELMWPERFPKKELDILEKNMGAYAVAAQMQQRPAPRKGGMFAVDNIKVIEELPDEPLIAVRAWDLAASEGAGAYSVGVLLYYAKTSEQFIIGDVKRKQLGAGGVRTMIQETAEEDGTAVQIILPQDPGQAGKPIWEEESVLMGNGGMKKLKDVRVGDEVVGMDSIPHRVTEVFIQGELETLKIKTECGREIIAAPDHPFLTPDGWVNAGDLKVNMSLASLTKAKTEPTSFRTPEEARLAGYFVGDGSVGRAAKAGPNGSCHAEFTCADADQLQDFKFCVNSLGGEVVSRPYRDIMFGTKGLQKWLRETDLAGKTSYTKEVPKWVFESSDEVVANFIGAFFDCDGTISKAGDEVVFYSVSKTLLSGIQSLLLRFGISSTLKTKNGTYLEKRHRSWLLRLRQQDDAYGRFARRIPLHNSFKKERLTKTLERARFRRFDEEYLPDRIVSIEPAGKNPCRCISVDDAKSFVVNDIVVHNSQVEDYIHMLLGYDARAEAQSGAKETRAGPLSAQIEIGRVSVLQRVWTKALLDEMRFFPKGKFKDQVDAASSAFNALAAKTRVAEKKKPLLTLVSERQDNWAKVG
jgi:hypothetical protein